MIQYLSVYLSFILAVGFLSIGSVFDFKYREIPNVISYLFLIGSFFLIMTYFPSIPQLTFCIIALCIILILFIFKKIGGADAKFLIALAVCFPVPFISINVFPIVLIVLYAAIFSVLSLIPLKKRYPTKTVKELATTYKYPYVVSLLFAVILMFFINVLPLIL